MGSIEDTEKQYKLILGTNPNDATTHSNYGNLLYKMGRIQQAVEHYQLALELNSNDATTHSNYGNFLYIMHCWEEAEEHYKLALKSDPNNAGILCNYGVLLSEMWRKEEAEEKCKLALKLEPNNANIYYYYGYFLVGMERWEEAEEHYKLALKLDPNNAYIYDDYGNYLKRMGRKEEAEEYYKLALKYYKLALKSDPNNIGMLCDYGDLLLRAHQIQDAESQYKYVIKLCPKNPNSHSLYSLFLARRNLALRAFKEERIASRLWKESVCHIKEHQVKAEVSEIFAYNYYKLRDYEESGKCAELSGNDYIEMGKYARGKSKNYFLTKGYMLKGRAQIRKLDIKPSFYKRMVQKRTQPQNYEIETLTRTMDYIANASKWYQKAAEISPGENQICDACSTSMLCLSDMLDYMLAVIMKKKEVPKLKDKIKNWDQKITLCRGIYKGKQKGEAFINSLEKLKMCIENLEEYKISRVHGDERIFEECVRELNDVARNIEGPLQKIIEDSAKKMNACRHEYKLYSDTFTESNYEYIPKLNWLLKILELILKNPIITGTIAGVVAILIQKKYFP